MVAQLFQKTPALHVLLRCPRVRCQHEKFAAPNIQIEERRDFLRAIHRMDRLVSPRSKQEFLWHSTKTTDMQLKHKILITLTTLGATVLTLAQDNPPPGGPGSGPSGPGGRRRPPMALFGALDANHDGVIDAAEIANAAEALKSMDKNGDGSLTMDELMGPRPTPAGADASVADHDAPPPDGGPQGPPPGQGSPGPGDRHRPPPIAVIGALDANHDGVVDATEIANAPVALKSLDKNGDGKLTPDELIGPRPKGMRPGGPGAGPGPDHGDESQPTPPQQQ